MNGDIKLSNLPTSDIDGLVDLLSDTYIQAIEAGVCFGDIPSVMLWGPPGVGKSQAVRQIAKEIETRTQKTCVVTDVRLLLFNPIDLRGIPTANEEKTLAVWLKPQIFQMDSDDSIVNILFLDEISAAPQSVQAAAYQITLDRTVGEHKLPDNCIVIAAGNRTTDKSVAYKMPKALANRLLHIEVSGGFESWKRWAVNNGINEKVLGYLSYREDAIMRFDASNEELAFATPRSWEMVSKLLNLGGSIDSKFMLISGLIGVDAAVEFRTWCQVYESLPKMEDIFMKGTGAIPYGADSLYALVAAMTAYARNHKDDLEQIGNSISFSQKLPPDFATVLMRNYIYIEKGYKEKLIKIPEFSRWLNSKGSLLNGIV